MIGPDIRSTISNLNISERGSSFVILDKLEIELDVDVSILPKALNLPKVKVFGKLPLLKLSLNDYQYKVMMQLIDRCIPDLESPENEVMDSSSEASACPDSSDDNSSKEVAALRQTLSRVNNMSEAELSQALLQLKFDVETIHLSIYKCSDAKTMKSELLVNVIGDKLASFSICQESSRSGFASRPALIKCRGSCRRGYTY